MGFNEYHMYIRSVQMESAPFKDDAGKPPPIFMTDVQEDDGSVYKLVFLVVCNVILFLFLNG